MRGNCGIKDSRSSVTNADSRELLNYSDLSKILHADAAGSGAGFSRYQYHLDAFGEDQYIERDWFYLFC